MSSSESEKATPREIDLVQISVEVSTPTPTPQVRSSLSNPFEAHIGLITSMELVFVDFRETQTKLMKMKATYLKHVDELAMHLKKRLEPEIVTDDDDELNLIQPPTKTQRQ